MKTAIIDYESYYDKDTSVVTMGNINYSRAADAYIVAATVGDEVFCGTIAEMQPIIDNITNDPTVQPWAANSNFDQSFAAKYSPTPLANNWNCILDVARFNQFPGNLASLSKVVLGKAMDKGVRDEMKGKRYEDLPEDGAPLSKKAVQEYCLTDVIRSKEVLDAMPPMSATEERIAAHTRLINRRGVHIDMALVEADKTRMEEMRFNAFRSIPWYRDAKPLSPIAMKDFCVRNNLPVPKSRDKKDEETTNLMSEHPLLNKIIGHMRDFQHANALLKKAASLQARVSEEGIMPLDLIYCGAPHTRRWSSKGFNVQNLEKKPMLVTGELPENFGKQGGPNWEDLTTGKVVLPGVKWVWNRNWIVPPPGHEFLILDYAQVEPRVLNWLAGNEPMMKALREGFSYYEAYATFARGWKGAPGTLKKEYGVVKYTLLKNECLGLGYGMGVNRFVDYAAENGNSITAAEAKPVVDGFRRNNRLITGMWRKLDGVITSGARDVSRHFGIELPSGDLLQYFSVRAKAPRGFEGFTVKGDFGENSRQRNLWGGTLTENVTQRVARDILAEALLNMEANGFPVAFSAHDEGVFVVPIPRDEKERVEIKAEAEHVFMQTPPWAKGLPLGAEGDFATCYTKF